MIGLLCLAFVLSGAAGLIYESIWTRYLGLFVGHDAYAQILVLVIFLGGMSAGALAVGRRSERLGEPLKGYALIEFVVGCIGLAFHEIFGSATGLAYEHLFPALAGSWALLPAKWLVASLLILPQSILLGATFPLMSAGVIRLAPAQPGRILALLYFANSLGAAVGVIVAGFYLTALAGLPGTLTVAAMLNLVVAVLTLFVVVAARSRAPAIAAPAEPDAAPASGDAAPASRLPAPTLQRLLLFVSFGTAVASFVYEIDWIRMLSLVLGSATHSFELMLSAFILGLALGALWIRARADRLADPVRTLGLVQWAMGALALATLPLYAASFSWIGALLGTFARTDAGYVGFTLARYALCLVIMLPATFCAGMTLPLITRTLMVSGSGERAIGAVYGWNTLGSIVGVALGGLVLMPLLGVKVMLVAGATMDMALGVLLLWAAAPRRAAMQRLALGAAVATLAVAIAGSAVRLEQRVLASGVFRSGQIKKADEWMVRYFRDGRTATVTAFEASANGHLSLATNGKPDASLGRVWFEPCDAGAPRVGLTGDASTQTLLPLVALAHVPRAKEAAVIGWGSGMTSHLLLGSPELRQVTTIEIEPEMLTGSRVFYPANRRAFDDPRSTVVIDDAKSHFAAGNRKYDLILSEPSNPWVSGVAGLFTTEFYARIRTYLSDDGVFGQWLHMYELDDGLVLSVLAAIHRNFPSYEIYLVARGDLLVVASNRPSLPPPDWSVVRLPEVRRDLCRFHELTPEALDAMWLAGRHELAPLLETMEPNSDFYPVLDLGAERRRFRGDFARGFQSLSTQWHPIVASIRGRRSTPPSMTVPPTPEIPRVVARAQAALLRGQAGRVPEDTAWAGRMAPTVFALDLWDAAMAEDRPPSSWPHWVRQLADAAAARNAGIAGVVDTGFFAAAERYMTRHGAPEEARAAVALYRGLVGWDFRTVAAAADRLIPEALARRAWVPADDLRDAAVIAKLHLGDAAGARQAFDTLAAVATRPPGDVRTRLLESYVQAAAGAPGAMARR